MSEKILSTDLTPGSTLTVEISGYTHDGRGVARAQGRVIFVPGAVMGEQVAITVTGQQKKVLSGRLLKVIKPSAERTEPLCPAYQSCGGCQLQHISYGEELAFKQGQVAAALRRIGGLPEDLPIQPVIAAEEIYHYRNKGVFHIARQGGQSSLCFWDENSHIPAQSPCELLFLPGIAGLAAWLQNQPLPDNISDLMLRQSAANGDLLLAAVLNDEDKNAVLPLLKAAQRQFAALKVCAVQTAKGWQNCTEQAYLTDALGNTAYQLSAPSFFQVNNSQMAKLLDTLAGLLAGDCECLLDAYCGIGTIGLYLAKNLPSLRRLIGVELNENAVQNARANAGLNNIKKAEFYDGKAEALFDDIAKRDRPDTVVVDPPRRGCHPTLLRGLLKLLPPRIAYVSCNPATLARDLAVLQNGGYRPLVIQPVDMFPRTHHVETVVLLAR